MPVQSAVLNSGTIAAIENADLNSGTIPLLRGAFVPRDFGTAIEGVSLLRVPLLGTIDCTNDLALIVLHPLSIFIFVFCFLVRKIPFTGIELTSQRVRGLRGTSELPGRKGVVTVNSDILPGTVDVPVYRPPVYRFALFTGVFFSCHPVTPVYRWYAGIPGWFMFSCSRSPSCCCTLPHTLLHTTQHNTLGVAGSSQHLPTHHAMCGRRVMPT